MNIERMTHLRDMLTMIPPERFNLRGWRSACGTTACAIGWALEMPYFQKLGFTKGVDFYGETTFCPEYMGQDGFEAIGLFFDISRDEAVRLFFDISYRHHGEWATPEGWEKPIPIEMVIARIDELLPARADPVHTITNEEVEA